MPEVANLHSGIIFQVVNVQVPFIFKHGVDYLNDSNNWLHMDDASGTMVTAAVAIMLGCKHLFLLCVCVCVCTCVCTRVCVRFAYDLRSWHWLHTYTLRTYYPFEDLHSSPQIANPCDWQSGSYLIQKIYFWLSLQMVGVFDFVLVDFTHFHWAAGGLAKFTHRKRAWWRQQTKQVRHIRAQVPRDLPFSCRHLSFIQLAFFRQVRFFYCILCSFRVSCGHVICFGGFLGVRVGARIPGYRSFGC
jgi:hypothetical protein